MEKQKNIRDFIAGNASPEVENELLNPQKPEEKEKKSEETNEDTEVAPDLKDLIFQAPNAPTKDEINAWKTRYGTVIVSGFSPKELIVFRPLEREEYRRIKLLASRQQDFSLLDYEEAIVETCVLWPQPDTQAFYDAFKKAGTYSTLYEQISQASNFAPPQVAAALMVEL